MSGREEAIYRVHLKPVFGELTLKQAIKHSEEYSRMIAKEKIKSTAKKEIRFLQKLIREGDPAFTLPKLKYRNPGNKFQTWQILELDEILSVIENEVPEQYRLPCKIALYTGMRRGNVLGLRGKDVDRKRKQVRFLLNKSAKEMCIPISNKLNEVFNQIRWPVDLEQLLFPEICGVALGISVSRAFTRAGYKWFSFHKLRHTAACYLLEKGVELPTISELLGHSTVNITMDFYARVKPEALREAVSKFDD